MGDIIDDLLNLHKQATTERSHYYVAQCCQRAIEEIRRLRKLTEERAAPDLLAALKASCGYLLNAKIDLETGCTKATAIKTIEGGLKLANAIIAKAEGRE